MKTSVQMLYPSEFIKAYFNGQVGCNDIVGTNRLAELLRKVAVEKSPVPASVVVLPRRLKLTLTHEAKDWVEVLTGLEVLLERGEDPVEVVSSVVSYYFANALMTQPITHNDIKLCDAYIQHLTYYSQWCQTQRLARVQ